MKRQIDRHDDDGVLIHPYGPHIFHTNSVDIFAYLSRFTQWRPYQHRVLASVDGQLVPMPINLDTVNKLYGLNLTAFQMEEFLASVAEKKDEVKTSEDVVSALPVRVHPPRRPDAGTPAGDGAVMRHTAVPKAHRTAARRAEVTQ